MTGQNRIVLESRGEIQAQFQCPPKGFRPWAFMDLVKYLRGDVNWKRLQEAEMV